MITLKKNANQIIGKMVFEDGVRACYYSVCERYANGYIQMFITDMQMLITKLGVMISEVSTFEVNISYCAQSITYICNKVLDNPPLEKTFDSIGINNKGNKGKHDIVTNKIDIERCVTTYNNLVNSISNKYGLSALKEMVVRKRTNDKKNDTSIPSKQPQVPIKQKSNQPNAKKCPAKQSVPGTTPEKFSYSNGDYTLNISFVDGKGYYTEGLIHKTKMINFKISVNLSPCDIRISKETATIKCGNNTEEFKLPRSDDYEQDFSLNASHFHGNIRVTITIEYKIGFLQTKEIKATISKTF